MLKKYRAAEPEAMAPHPIPASNGKAKPRTVTVSDEGDDERAYGQGFATPACRVLSADDCFS